MHVFNAFGLSIDSEITLPDFLTAEAESADVSIRYGAVPQSLEEPFEQSGTFQGRPGHLLMDVPNIARYLVTDGRSIPIERAASSTDDDVRTFLHGSCMGALLLQRGALVLHASAVKTPKGAVLFAGRSGDGKSTLAAALTQRGLPMMSDDITAIAIDDPQRPVAQSAFPCARLWDDAATHLDYPRQGQRKLRERLEGKYVLPVKAFHHGAAPIHRIYRLMPRGEDAIEIVTPRNAERFQSLARCSYRKKMLGALGVREQHFGQMMTLAQVSDIKVAHRPAVGYRLDALVDRIAADIGA